MIASSKLGNLVGRHWHSEALLIRLLRERQLVRSEVSDMLLTMVITQAREEHQAMSDGQQMFNSPDERTRVFLEPYLTRKGRRWAVPLTSLTLDDDESTARRRGAAWVGGTLVVSTVLVVTAVSLVPVNATVALAYRWLSLALPFTYLQPALPAMLPFVLTLLHWVLVSVWVGTRTRGAGPWRAAAWSLFCVCIAGWAAGRIVNWAGYQRVFNVL